MLFSRQNRTNMQAMKHMSVLKVGGDVLCCQYCKINSKTFKKNFQGCYRLSARNSWNNFAKFTRRIEMLPVTHSKIWCMSIFYRVFNFTIYSQIGITQKLAKIGIRVQNFWQIKGLTQNSSLFGNNQIDKVGNTTTQLSYH